jgi:histidinol-phosphate aminotransferase
MSGPTSRRDDPAALVRPEVRALTAYRLDLAPCRFKLDQNEVPWPLPRPVRAAALARLAAADWSRYPDFHADELRRAIGELHGVETEAVLVGNGSNELLAAALAAFCGPGRELLVPGPSFSLYGVFALSCGGSVRRLGPRADLALPLDELEAEVERDPRRPVLVCSPNNPTGEAVPPLRIRRLLERLEAPLLLDNAYGEFCRYDYRPLLARHRHLVLFRTFSKAWSLAGIRLGYLLAHPALVTELVKVKLPYNLGHAGIACGLAALGARAAAERRVRQLVERRPQWSALLRAAGANDVVESEANFVLTRWEKDRYVLLKEGLPERGIRVRDVGGAPGLENCLRVSIAGGDALRATAGALAELSSFPSMEAFRSLPRSARGSAGAPDPSRQNGGGS